MAAIFGQCPKCPANPRPQRLFGGLCSYHLKNSGPTKKAKKEVQRVVKRAKK